MNSLQKKVNYILSVFILGAILIAGLTTCKIGLGEAVDIYPPEITLLYPPAKSVIREDFVMRGEVSDDNKVTSVSVSLKGTKGTLGEYGPFAAVFNEKTWSAKINSPVTNPPLGSPSYTIKDGSYEFIVTATDAAGRTNIATTVYEIDNTAPVVVLESPASKKIEKPEAFGAILPIKGSLYDAHNITKLVFSVWDKASKKLLIRKKIEDVVQTMDADIASFDANYGGAPDVNKFYNFIYTDFSGSGAGRIYNTQDFYYTVEAYDAAATYKDDASSSNEGNISDWFYLYSDIGQLDTARVKAKDLYDFFTGGPVSVTFTAAEIDKLFNAPAASFIGIKTKDLRSLAVNSSAPSTSVLGAFSLNPNLSPRYRIPVHPVLDPSSPAKLSDSYTSSIVSLASVIGIELESNLDKTLIASDVTDINAPGYVEIWADKYMGTENVSGKEKIKEWTSSLENPNAFRLWPVVDNKTAATATAERATRITFKVPMKDGRTGDSLGVGKYILRVTGNDIKGNKYANYGEIYGFELTGNNRNPDLKISSSENFAIGKTADFTIKGTAKSYAQDKTVTVLYKFNPSLVPGPDPVDSPAVSGTGEYIINKTLNASIFGVSTTQAYTITVEVKDSEGHSAYREITCLYDCEAPKVKDVAPDLIDINGIYSSPDSDVTKYYSGKPVISGKAADEAGGSGVAKIEYSLDSTDGINGTWANFAGSAEWQGTLNLTEEKEYKIYIRAADRAGNVSASVLKTILADLADPKASITQDPLTTKTDVVFSGEAHDNAKNHATLRQALDAKLSYTKDGGTAVNVAAGTAADQFNWDKSAGTWTWTFKNTLGDGKYLINLEVTDIAGKKTSVSRTVRLDTTKPEIKVNMPAEGAFIAVNSIDLKTEISDAGVGLKLSAIEYKLDTAGLGGGTWTALPNLSGNKYEKAALSLGGTKGKKTLFVRAEDLLGNVHELGPVNFYYDGAAPNLTETKQAAVTYLNAAAIGIDFGGVISDDWQLDATDPLKLTITKPDSSVSTVLPVITGTTWSYAFNTPDEGTHTLVFTAKDGAGRTASITRTIVVDKTVPAFITHKITTSSVDIGGTKWYTTSGLNIEGTASDGTGSGILRVEYSLNADPIWRLLAGTTSWSGSVVEVPDNSTIHVRLTDNAGNTAVYDFTGIRIDQTWPLVNITTPSGTTLVNKQNDLSITGTFTELGSGLADIRLKLGDNNFAAGDIITAVTSGSNWTAVFPKAKLDAKTLYVQARDKAGNVTTITGFAIQVDDVKPTVSFVSPDADSSINNTISLSGTAGDNQVLDTVKLYRKTGTAPSDWIEISGVIGLTNWSIDLDTSLAAYSSFDSNSAKTGIQLMLKVVATDKAGNENAVETTREFTIDQDSDRPIITITNINLFGMSASTSTVLDAADKKLTGIIQDDDGLITKLEISADGSVYSPLSMSNENFTYTFGAEGLKKLYFKVTDKKGKVFTSEMLGTTPSDLQATPKLSDTAGHQFGYISSADKGSVLNVQVDSAPPSLSLVKINGSLAPAVMHNLAQTTITGSAADTNALASLVIKAGTKTWNVAGISGVGTANWTQVINWGTGLTELDDGTHELIITLTDAAGKTVSAERSLTIDRTSPILGLTSPTADAFFNQAQVLPTAGTASDLHLAKVQYALIAGHGKTIADVAAAAWKNANGTTVWTADINATGLSDGAYTLIVKAEDTAGNIGSVNCNLNADKTKPVLNETTFSAAKAYTKNTNETFGGSITDSNLESLTYIWKKNGGAFSVPTAIVPTANTWSLSVSGLSDGNYSYVFTAKDKAGNETSVERSFIFDNIAPLCSISQPAANAYLLTDLNASQVISGTASDAGSGLDSIKIEIPGLAVINVPVLANWSSLANLSSLAATPTGHTATVTVTDKAGNTVSATRIFQIDKEAPTAGITVTKNAAGNDPVLIDGINAYNMSATVTLSLSDASSGIVTGTTMSIKKDGVLHKTYSDIGAAPFIGTKIVPPSDISGDGLYEFSLSAKDGAGRISTATEILRVDTTPPSISLTNPTSNSAQGSAVTVSGTVLDSGSGLAGSATYISPEDGTAQNLGTSFTFKPGEAEGTKSLVITAKDKVGNTKTETVNFNYDKNPPELSDIKINGNTATTVMHNGTSAVITGKAVDTNALESVLITAGTKTWTVGSIGGTSANWSQTIAYGSGPSELDDGSHVLTITVKDKAGKTSFQQRTLIIDKTPPSITSASITTSSIDLGGTKWYKQSLLAIEAAASDTGSGIASLFYSADGTNWSALTKSGTNWIGNVPVPNGVVTIGIKAFDAAGNVSSINSLGANVDVLVPETLELDTVDGAASVTDKLTNAASPIIVKVKGAADNLSGSGPATVKLVKIGSNNITAAASNVLNGAAEITISSSDLTAGTSGGVVFRLTDKVGNFNDFTLFSITKDTTAPAASISQPVNNATVNKSIKIEGTASDNKELSSVELQRSTDGGASWSVFGNTIGTHSWNCTIDTATYSDAAGQGSFMLRAHVKDAAGNTANSTVLNLTIDQDEDRPIISFTNLKLNGMSSTNSVWLNNVNTIYGNVMDDDGLAGLTLEVSQDNGGSWTNETLSNGSFAYNTGADGQKSISFRVKDARGGVFTSIALGNTTLDLNSPKLIDTAAVPVTYAYRTSADKGSRLNVRVDTERPEIKNTIYIDTTPATASEPNNFDDVAPVEFTENMNLGGKKQKFALKITAKDASGINALTVKAGSTVYTAVRKSAASPGSDEVFITPTLDTTNFSEGVYTLVISASDNSGAVSTINCTIQVDNTAPSLTVTSPALNSQVTGIVNVRGTTNDNAAGSGVASVKYVIPKRNAAAWTVPAEDSSDWKSLPGTLTWAIEFNGSTPELSIATYANATYGIETANGSNLWEVPILFRIEDNTGNIRITEPSACKFIIDPDGDKPKVSVNYPVPVPPAIFITLGGAIRVFGTANDNEVVNSVWMQIDTNNDGIFDITDKNALAAYTKTPGGPPTGPKVYTVEHPGSNDTAWDWGIKTSGTNSWYLTLNEFSEFDPSSGIKIIRFRVRAMDDDKDVSTWSAPITINIDKTAPKIGSAKPLVLKQFDAGGATIAEQVYVPDMWIRGEWFLTGSIQDESGIDTVSITGGLSGNLGTAGWFTAASYGTDTGFDMKIPVGGAAASGLLEFNIGVQDKSAPSQSSTRTISVRRDNEAPNIAAVLKSKGLAVNDSTNTVRQSDKTYTFGSTATESGSGFSRIVFWFERNLTIGVSQGLHIYNVMEDKASNTNRTKLAGLDISDGIPRLKLTGVARDSETTLSHASIVNNKNIRKGGLVKIGGLDRFIDLVDYTSGKVTFSPGLPLTYTEAALAYGMVVNNQTVEALTAAGVIANDDGDGMVESVERSGANYDWTASINSKNIPDGPISIKYIAFDLAGNASSVKSIVSKVENNRPAIAKVTLGTDLNGNNLIDSHEQQSYSTLDANNKAQYIAEVNALGGTAKFSAKAKTTVTPEIVGGNGSLFYSISVNGAMKVPVSTGGPGSTQIRIGDSPTPEAAVATSAILMDVDASGKLMGLDDSSTAAGTKFLFTIWDSTEEGAIGSTTQFAALTVHMHVDAQDGIEPKSVLKPLYWTSDTDNSLLENKRQNGHIELEADLPAALFTAATGVMDKDPKVSGKVSLRGTAYDDQRITEIWAKIDGFTFKTGAANLTTATIGGEAGWVQLAKYSGGAWLPAGGNINTDGWQFSASDINLIAQDGHRVEWRLDWDSSKIAGVVGADVNVRVVSKDRGGNYAPLSITGVPSDGETVYNKPLYRMDVVPYITGIKREAKYNTARSSGGTYNVLRGDKLTVEGFNIGTNLAQIQPSGIAGPVALTSGNTFTLAATAKSGPVQFRVGSIEALHNKNSNGAVYNRQVIQNRDETKYWTDDLSFHVWKDDESFPGSVNPKYPAMAMGSNGDLYASFSNYSEASVYYSRLGGAVQTVFYTYDPPEETAISVAGSGIVNVLYSANYHGGTAGAWTNDSTQSGGLYCYDPAAAEIDVGRSPYRRVHRFELFYHDTQLQQFSNFRVARGGNDRIHICYYDTLSQSVKYASIMNNAFTSRYTENRWVNLDGNSDSHDIGTSYAGGPSSVVPVSNFEDGLGKALATAEYCALALDNSNKPVVVYADVDTGNLRLARADSDAPTHANNWKVQKVLASGDINEGLASDYFTAKFDSNGFLHIAFRNSRGQLCYVKSTNANALPSQYTFGPSVIVDELGGAWADITLDGQTPYISYMAKVNAYDGVRVAYYDSNFAKTWNADGTPAVTGSWHVMTGAMMNRAVNVRTCVAAAPASVTAWKAAVGYSTGARYNVVKFIGP